MASGSRSSAGRRGRVCRGLLGPPHGWVSRGSERIQPSTPKGVGRRRGGDRRHPGQGRAESADREEQAAPRRAEPEALPARRKRREWAGAVGACSVNAEDPRSRTGRGCDEVCQEKAKRAGPLTVRCRCRAQVDPSGPPQGQCTQCFLSDRRVCALSVQLFRR